MDKQPDWPMDRERQQARAPSLWKLWLGLGVLQLFQFLSRVDEFRWLDLIPLAATIVFFAASVREYRMSRRAD